MKKIILLFIGIAVLFSCNETKKETPVKNPEIKKSEIAASYKNIEVEIEGMTCEIGCARTIESKISKIDGVSYSKVNFEAKKGQFTYDENKVTKEEIINKIASIGGGDLYKVVKTSEFEKFE